MSRNKVVIVAGGRGSRMGTEMPKQFLLLAGRPVLMYSIEAFHHFDPDISIIVVLPEDHLQEWEKIKEKHQFKISHQTLAGGATRFQSVSRGLSLLPDQEGIVAVHDGVRPLIEPSTIALLFENAKKKGNAIPYSLPADSIRIEKKDTNVIIDRSSIRLIQTPQVFHTSLLQDAYRIKEHPSFTDDASVIEKAGQKVHLVECPAGNIKITRPEDLKIANALVSRSN
jgi:2-C-methyl-D-erythritol 4-phosphate cytidylyltransferase